MRAPSSLPPPPSTQTHTHTHAHTYIHTYIQVGTLAVAGLKEAMANLRALIAAADKHSYTMLVGKPNPTKLANFPEVCACACVCVCLC